MLAKCLLEDHIGCSGEKEVPLNQHHIPATSSLSVTFEGWP